MISTILQLPKAMGRRVKERHMKFPVQIQADDMQADDSQALCMCHVFDRQGLTTVFNALAARYCHVVAWDADAQVVSVCDNR